MSSKITAKLPALLSGHPLLPEILLILISVRKSVDPRATMRLEKWGQLKNAMTSSRIKPVTFKLVAQYLNQLGYPNMMGVMSVTLATRSRSRRTKQPAL
jgi:hypothetical protein